MCSETVGKRAIGTGGDLEMQRCRRGGRCQTRVDDNKRSAAFLLLLEILHDRWHGFRQVAAGQKNGFRFRYVGKRKRKSAVDAERLDRCGGRGGHAKPAVVVNLRSP